MTMFGFWKVRDISGSLKDSVSLGPRPSILACIHRNIDGYKIQYTLLPARSSGVGAGNASSLKKIGMGRCRRRLIGPDWAVIVIGLVE